MAVDSLTYNTDVHELLSILRGNNVDTRVLLSVVGSVTAMEQQLAEAMGELTAMRRELATMRYENSHPVKLEQEKRDAPEQQRSRQSEVAI